MMCGFWPRDRDRTTESMEGVWMGSRAVMKWCWAATKEAFTVPRLTVGVSNGLQMERNLTGGLPAVYQGHLANLGPSRECLTPAHDKRQEGNAGGHRSVRLQNGQRGKCSDARDKHVCKCDAHDDMI